MFTYANSMSQLSITSKCGMLPLAAALMIVAVAYAGHAAAADWKPEKNVEIVAMSGPGGANDVIARALQRIMQQMKLVEAPITVVSKVGPRRRARLDLPQSARRGR